MQNYHVLKFSWKILMLTWTCHKLKSWLLQSKYLNKKKQYSDKRQEITSSIVLFIYIEEVLLDLSTCYEGHKLLTNFLQGVQKM